MTLKSEQKNYNFCPCEYEGCTQEGSPYTYPEYTEPGDPDRIMDPEEGSTHYYCTDHAAIVGFCIGCEVFWGGVESFEFSIRGRTGLKMCDDCWNEFKLDNALDDEGEIEEYSKAEEERRDYEQESYYSRILGD